MLINLNEDQTSLFRAALKTSAVYDVRYYLNGVHINAEKGRIEATDGHRLFMFGCKDAFFDLSNNTIVSVVDPVKNKSVKALPKNWDTIAMNFVDMTITGYKRSSPVGMLKLERIDVQLFPDVDRVVPKPEAKEHSDFGFNPLLIADISTACDRGLNTSMVFEVANDNAALFSFAFTDNPNIGVVMGIGRGHLQLTNPYSQFEAMNHAKPEEVANAQAVA